MARRRRQNEGPPTDERKIQFYRIWAGRNISTGLPNEFDAGPALSHIEGLEYTRAGAYLQQADGGDVCCWVDSTTSPQKIRLANIRRKGFPQIEELGDLSALTIAELAGIAETTHMMFFPNNIVGAEFNFYGPRPSKLGTYINAKAEGHGPRITVNPLLRDNAAQEIAAMRNLRLFDLKVRRSVISVIREADENLGSALDATADVADAAEVELVLRARPRSDDSLSDAILEAARNIVSKLPFIRDDTKRFRAIGTYSATGEVKEVDLLSDAFVSEKRIILIDEKSRALNADSAYAKIQEAYNELSAALSIAPDLSA